MSILYPIFDIAEQQLTVAARHPERIKVLSAMTLTGRGLR